MYKGPEKGAFEVKLQGKLIHSKLTMSDKGHGKCQTDAELDGIIDAITEWTEKK